jgi:hypothetical protein
MLVGMGHIIIIMGMEAKERIKKTREGWVQQRGKPLPTTAKHC